MRSINKVKLEKIVQTMIYGWFRKIETHNQLVFIYNYNSKEFSLCDPNGEIIIDSDESVSSFIEKVLNWLEEKSIEL